MRNRVILLALAALVLTGCPAGGFFGRYLIVNSTGSTVSNLKISSGIAELQTWEETISGQGWIHSQAHGPTDLTVSWSDDTGDHEQEFSFKDKVRYRSVGDLYVELQPNGVLSWRMIDRPTEDGGPSTNAALAVYYLWYCLGVALLLGVPLALTGVFTYGLFKLFKSCLLAMLEGLRGDNTSFQFSIREILLLTTTVALALSWVLHFYATRGP